MKSKLPAFAALVLASGLSATALAAERPSFQWSPDDLASLDRIAVTHDRIEAMAYQYCREYLYGTRELARTRDCASAVVEEIVLSVDDARLTAYSRTGTVSQDLLARR